MTVFETDWGNRLTDSAGKLSRSNEISINWSIKISPVVSRRVLFFSIRSRHKSKKTFPCCFCVIPKKRYLMLDYFIDLSESKSWTEEKISSFSMIHPEKFQVSTNSRTFCRVQQSSKLIDRRTKKKEKLRGENLFFLVFWPGKKQEKRCGD